MLFYLTDDKAAKVEFWHDMTPKVLTVEHEGQVIETPVKGETNCLLTTEGKNYLGTTYCSLVDEFKAATGCKKALARAMRDAGMSKEDRAYIWAELSPMLK